MNTTTTTTQRFMILGITSRQGQVSYRILDTDTFEFEPRKYNYYPRDECKALNENGDAIPGEVIDITPTESR